MTNRFWRIIGRTLVYQPVLRQVARGDFDALVIGHEVKYIASYLLLFYFAIRDLLRCEFSAAIVERARADNLEWMLAATRICMIGFMVFSIFSDLWDLIFSYFLFSMSAALIQRYQPSRPVWDVVFAR